VDRARERARLRRRAALVGDAVEVRVGGAAGGDVVGVEDPVAVAVRERRALAALGVAGASAELVSIPLERPWALK
jgi:hypothetical protein